MFRPFDPQYYEDEFEDEEMLDEEGRTRLKLKVLSTFAPTEDLVYRPKAAVCISLRC